MRSRLAGTAHATMTGAVQQEVPGSFAFFDEGWDQESLY
jgi:hypothetical protein